MERMRLWVVAALLAASCGDDGGGGDGGMRDADGRTDATRDASGDDGGGGTDASGGDAATGDGGMPPVDDTPAEFRYCEAGGGGRELTAGPGDYLDVLGTMMPGDVLRLAAGTYDGGLPIRDMNGSEGSCFIIEGPAAGPTAVFTGSSSRNTVSIVDSSYVVIRRLELDGLGLQGDGLKAEGTAAYAHHIVIEGLHIHDHDANQQIVGINTKCPTWHWVIRGNLIERAGTGLYLGGSEGDTPFVAGLIERNVVLDTIGYNMQIKHQIDRPAVPGIPDSGTTIIRRNVFSKENGSGSSDPRPNLLVGHFPLSGPGQDDQYLIYGNLFHENPVEALFQGEGNVALYANLFVNTVGPAVHVQPHNDVPRRVHVFGNTVVASGTGIRVTGGAAGFPQIVAGNAVFAGSPITGGEQRDNATGAYGEAPSALAAPAAPAGGGLDLHPLPGQLGGTIDTTGLDAFLAFDRDFDGRMRAPAFRGAYEGPAAAGAWMPARAPIP